MKKFNTLKEGTQFTIVLLSVFLGIVVLFTLVGITASKVEAQDKVHYNKLISQRDPRVGIVYLTSGGSKTCDGSTLVYTSDGSLFSSGMISTIPQSEECRK
jgi:hypothetical protein